VERQTSDNLWAVLEILIHSLEAQDSVDQAEEVVAEEVWVEIIHLEEVEAAASMVALAVVPPEVLCDTIL
jgi:hypothetical protein